MKDKGAIMRATTIIAMGLLLVTANAIPAQDKTEQLPAAINTPSDPGPHAQSPVAPGDCQSCKGGGAQLQHLLAWALYRPPAHCCCRCLPRPVPCCTPPLYAWFPCH